MNPNLPAKSSPGKLYRASKNLPTDPVTSFTSKTILITSANTGVGYEAALKPTRLGTSTVIPDIHTLSTRTAAKTQTTRVPRCSG